MSALTANNATVKFFKEQLLRLLRSNSELSATIYEVFINGGYAYVVGGYVRDLLNNTQSRDVDIIIDLPKDKFERIINTYCTNYSINRHGGIKIHIGDYSVDMWRIDDNWAFKNELINYNENNVLESIAAGCFYDYDALVVNMLSGGYNIHYYTDCIRNKQLAILRQNPNYSNLNPTVEANILRAFYLKKTQNLEFSSSVSNYIINKMPTISLDIKEALQKLLDVKKGYPKYEILTMDYIKQEYRKLLYSNNQITNEHYLLSYDFLLS